MRAQKKVTRLFYSKGSIQKHLVTGIAAAVLLCTGQVNATTSSEVSVELAAYVQQLRATGAQPAMVDALLVRALENGIPEASMVDVVHRLHDLYQRGLPVEPVLSRYLQGLSKGVPISRIDRAADAVEARLALAARHVDRRSQEQGVVISPEERLRTVDSAAYALGAGLSEEQLDKSLDLVCRDLAEGKASVGENDLNAPVLAVGMMVSGGVDGSRSYEIVSQAWRQGYRSGDLQSLSHAVLEIGKQSSPSQAADRVLDLLSQNYDVDGLFQTLDAIQAVPAGEGVLPGGNGNDPVRGRLPTPGEERTPEKQPKRAGGGN